MDIVRVPQQTPLYIKYWYVPVATLCVIAFAFFAQKYEDVSTIVFEDELLIGTVATGELLLEIRGYGRLVPKSVYRIGAETDGVVEQIYVQAGDSVEKGDYLVRLSNIQLLQQLEDAKLEYEIRKAEARSFRIELESQLLDLKAEVANAEVDHQNAKMELDAHEKLLERGYPMARIEHERVQSMVQKNKQRWDVQRQRAGKYEERLLAKVAAEQARQLQSKNEVEKVQYQVEGLYIRASADGIVQEMSLGIGQAIRQGHSITEIVRPEALIAEVKIPELQVQDIQLGMHTTIDTRSNLIKGRVSRIDPKVVDGSVLVNVELLGDLPSEVRPDLNIEANIEVARIANAQHVRRPVFARASANTQVFKIDSSGDIAERVPVEFGRASTNVIEIKSGLEVGDQIIISDTSTFEMHRRIFIK
ncbi:MAG: HlyD family efflux transporter periplasmic adaptor subunit [Cellvibrionaceae bacterium]